MLIVGTGAVASFMAQKLSSTACSLQFFGAPSDRLHSLSMRFEASGVSRPAAVEDHRMWIVAVKTWQNLDKIGALSSAPRPEAILVLQNGLCPERAWQCLQGVRVERGLSTYGVKSQGPGRIAGGSKGTITLPKDSAFASSLTLAGLSVAESTSMKTAIWHKLAVNASLNVVASLFGLTNGEVLQHREAANQTRQAAFEVSQVAVALGIDWGSVSPWQMTERVARETALNVCSTLADIRLGRPTEYEAINGAVLSKARECGVETPVLERLDRHFRARLGQVSAKPTPMPTFRAQLPLLEAVTESPIPQLKAGQA